MSNEIQKEVLQKYAWQEIVIVHSAALGTGCVMVQWKKGMAKEYFLLQMWITEKISIPDKSAKTLQ